jgi:metal-responsive CopG/Arc/MetJ family transcriptional regulator
MAKTRRIQALLDEDLVRRVDAEVKKMGMNRSEFIRLALEQKLSNDAAYEGIDSIMKLLRKLLADELNPQFNRLAKMIAKNIKASATTMYMQLIELSTNEKLNAFEAFQQSEAKAVAYLNNRDN